MVQETREIHRIEFFQSTDVHHETDVKKDATYEHEPVALLS